MWGGLAPARTSAVDDPCCAPPRRSVNSVKRAGSPITNRPESVRVERVVARPALTMLSVTVGRWAGGADRVPPRSDCRPVQPAFDVL